MLSSRLQNNMQKIFVAAYPEVHPLAQSTKSDLDWLKRKQDAGATAAIQPGGAIRDPEVIAAADARGMAMVFTACRHFKH